MPLTTPHYDLVIPQDSAPDNIDAWADALSQVGNADTQERIQMARSQKPQHMLTVMRYAIQGILNTWVKEADWNKRHGYAVGH